MRFVVLLTLLLLMPTSAHAEDAGSSATATTSIPVAPIDKEAARQQRLDQLLGKLHSAPIHADVSKYEEELWQLWSHNASPTAEVLLRESSAAIDAGDFEPSEQMLSTLLETYPKFAEGWNRRAAMYYALKRYDAALVDVDHAIDLEPRNYSALLGKGMILRTQGKNDEAIALFNEALAINPHLAYVRLLIAQIEKSEPHI